MSPLRTQILSTPLEALFVSIIAAGGFSPSDLEPVRFDDRAGGVSPSGLELVRFDHRAGGVSPSGWDLPASLTGAVRRGR
jgi:hypothetical protein